MVRVGFIRVYALLGDTAALQREHERLLQDNEKSPITDQDWFELYTAIGDLDNAFAHLNSMIDNRFPAIGVNLLFQNPDHPVYSSLRGDKRFDAALRRINASRRE